VAGLALAAILLASRSRYPKLYLSLSVAYLVIVGSLGTVLLALWTLTMHHAAWANTNLLVFNPLAFVILVWRARRGGAALRLTRLLVACQLAALLVGVVFLLSGASQQNLPWLLFGIPVWLAIAMQPTRHGNGRAFETG
jgi:hypothetical protein